MSYFDQYAIPDEEEQQQQPQAAAAPVDETPPPESSYFYAYADPEYSASEAQSVPAEEEELPERRNEYVPGTNRVLDTAFAVGNKVGDVVERVGGEEWRRNLEGFAPPVEEIAEADGIADKIITAMEYWDRPFQSALERGIPDALEKGPPEPKSVLSREYLEELAGDLQNIKEHPEQIFYEIGRNVLEQPTTIWSGPWQEEPGFTVWAEQNPDIVDQYRDQPDVLWEEYKKATGQTWETGGLIGWGKGVVTDSLVDPALVGSLITTGGAASVARPLAQKGLVGTARGITRGADAVDLALGGPGDVVLNQGAGLIGRGIKKIAPDSVKNLFDLTPEAKQQAMAEGIQEVSQGTGQIRQDYINEGLHTPPASNQGTGAATQTPPQQTPPQNPPAQTPPQTPPTQTPPTQTPPQTPPAQTPPQTPPNNSGTAGSPGVPVGGRSRSGTAPNGQQNSFNLDLGPDGKTWMRDGRELTQKDFHEFEDFYVNVKPEDLDRFIQEDLMGKNPKSGQSARPLAAMRQGLIDPKTGRHIPYMANDWSRRRIGRVNDLIKQMPDGPNKDERMRVLREMAKASRRNERAGIARIKKYGYAEIERQLRQLNLELYRGLKENQGLDPRIWWDNQREVIADIINRSDFDQPVDLGWRFKKDKNGQYYQESPIIANRGKPGTVIKLEDFMPDPRVVGLITGDPNTPFPLKLRPDPNSQPSRPPSFPLRPDIQQDVEILPNGAQIKYLYDNTPDLEAWARQRLDQLGLTDVALHIIKFSDFAAGYYQPANKSITLVRRLSKTGQISSELQFRQVVDHEAIHAFRDLGLIKHHEWQILVREAYKHRSFYGNNTTFRTRANETHMKLYRQQGITGIQLQELLDEEAVAELFSYWRLGRHMDPGVKTIFQRLYDFLTALGALLRGTSAEKVMLDLESGKIGQRPRGLNPGVFGPKQPVGLTSEFELPTLYQVNGSPAPAGSTVAAPPPPAPAPAPQGIIGKFRFNRAAKKAAQEARTLSGPSKYDGLPIPDGYEQWLDLDVNGKSVYQEIIDTQDELEALSRMHSGADPITDQKWFDERTKHYTEHWEALYGKENPVDFGALTPREMNAFMSHYVAQKWVDAQPKIVRPHAKGLIGSVLKVSRGVGDFRSSTGLYNWVAAPRQFLNQHAGNTVNLMLNKPSAITKMFSLRTLNAYRKANAQSRRGLNGPLAGARTDLTDAIEEIGLPVNGMIHRDTGKTGIVSMGGDSNLPPWARKLKDVVAPRFLRDWVSIPDAMFRDAVASVTFIPAVRRFQRGYAKEAAGLAQEWIRRKGVMVDHREVHRVVEDVIKANHNRDLNMSTVNGAKIEKALKEHFANRPVGDRAAFDNLANRIARDYQTKLNTEYQLAAAETRKLAFSWDATNIDAALRHVFLYHYWSTRAGGLYLKSLAKNPWMTANFARMAMAAEEEARDQDYPEWMRGYFQLLSSPGGSILFANPFNMFGTMLTFADWQYGLEPEKLGQDLTLLGRLRGIAPALINPLWDSAAWALGFYGGEDARPVYNPTGFEHIPKLAIDLINAANVSGHLPPGMLRDENNNPIILPDRPLTELVAKFSSAIASTVRDDAQPIPNLFASHMASERADLLQILTEEHPEWDANQVMRAADMMLNDAANGDYSPEMLEAQRLSTLRTLQGPELDFLSEPVKGAAGAAIRLLSPIPILNRPEMQLALKSTPIHPTGRDPIQLPEMNNEFSRGAMQSIMYDTDRQRSLDIARSNWYGDDELKQARDTYYNVLNANVGEEGVIIGGKRFSRELLMKATDYQRGQLARQALGEAGFTTQDLETYNQMRNALEETNPDLAGYFGYTDAIRNADDPKAFIDELYRTEPGFRRMMDKSGKEKGSEEWYNKAAQWTETYMGGFLGERTSLYDPEEVPPASPRAGEWKSERDEYREEKAEKSNSLIGKYTRSVNEAILAQQLLEQEYPGYGYRIGSGSLPGPVWDHMKQVWKAADIDTSYITKSSHYGAQYINWALDNPHLPDRSFQAFFDATFTDDGSNKFADQIDAEGTAGELSGSSPVSYDLDGPLNIAGLRDTFGLDLMGDAGGGGQQIAITGEKTTLRQSPGGSAITMLPGNLPLVIKTIDGQWALVEAPGGFEGYVPVSRLMTA